MVATASLCLIITLAVFVDNSTKNQQKLSSLSKERIYEVLEEKNIKIPDELKKDLDIKSFIKYLEENPDAHMTIGWDTLGDFAETCSNAAKEYNHSEAMESDVSTS